MSRGRDPSQGRPPPEGVHIAYPLDLASQRIRDKLWYGILPNVDPVSTCAEHGSGRDCDGCELVIGPKEAEHEAELASGRTLRFHPVCGTLWQILRTAPPSS